MSRGKGKLERERNCGKEGNTNTERNLYVKRPCSRYSKETAGAVSNGRSDSGKFPEAVRTCKAPRELLCRLGGYLVTTTPAPSFSSNGAPPLFPFSSCPMSVSPAPVPAHPTAVPKHVFGTQKKKTNRKLTECADEHP